MNAQGKHARPSDRVEALLRTRDSAPWSPAPEALKARVAGALRDAPRAQTAPDSAANIARRWAIAACLALCAGAAGVVIGAATWGAGGPDSEPIADARPIVSPMEPPRAEAPSVVLARAFGDLRPAGPTRLVDAVAAPMRTEAQGLATETTNAAKTVLSRLPFVSMD